MRLPNCLRDPLIRRKARFAKIPLDQFSIGIARTLDDYEEAFGLVHVGYVFQGIERLHPVGMRITEQHVLPESTVFVAREAGQLIGTLTVTMDSPAGLCLDADYPEEISALRGDGVLIAEIGSLAVVRRCWHSGVTLMLVVAAIRHALRLGATHFVAGVHPRAGDYHRAVWSFQPLGGARQHSQLRAPVAGFFSDAARLRAHFSRHYQRPMGSGVSPYQYLFDDVAWPWPDDMPAALSAPQRARWKMPRKVFREVFLRDSDRLRKLSDKTRAHLRCRRSDATVSDTSGAILRPSLAGVVGFARGGTCS